MTVLEVILGRQSSPGPLAALAPCTGPLARKARLSGLRSINSDYPTRDGTCVRDYVHVVDLAQAHILALGALDDGSRFYNLGNGEGFTVKEVIDTASDVTGKKIRTEIGPRRPGDPAVLVASSDKIRKELGWAPQSPHVRAIIESAWRWHQAFPDGYPE